MANPESIQENEVINLTEAATKKLTDLRDQDPENNQYLRLMVQGGGCSGFEYGMAFVKETDGDTVVTSSGVKIVIDSESLKHLAGITINFNDGLHGKGFEFSNPNAKQTCGCGRSFN